MARSKARRASAQEPNLDQPALLQAEASANTPAAEGGEERLETANVTHEAMPGAGNDQATEPRKPTVTPDPRSIMSASIGEGNGCPRMQLLRSHRFKQMQMRFDRQPEDHHLMRLKEAGWVDRTENEGIWTKQVLPGQWQPVADAERLFKEIANAIRKEKGLEPVLLGHSVA